MVAASVRFFALIGAAMPSPFRAPIREPRSRLHPRGPKAGRTRIGRGLYRV
jgi:hypothetical protein